ncbi:hypothetical protein PYW07_015860 [Mythimna separata]|uniref:LITAF domain-containing protein n=1 Tax=Mythimna separata TaxID=271217 RepID=A0AAD8DUS1_MYTSE|nr:hypothetical protein PYW07_015860 [Mythimna separata]
MASNIYDPKNETVPPYTGGGPPPVVITQPTVAYQVPVIVGGQMGPKPAPITCRSCNQQIVTRVELKSSTKTHLFALLLCCVFFPCACLPYCIDSCHNADHYCPNCNAYIGSYTN